MALHLPFGLRQVKLTPINPTTGETVPEDAVMLPAARTFSFSESEDFEELEGDDTVIASHGAGPSVDWDLESGGLDLDAWKVLSGGTVTTSGSGSTAKTIFTKKTTDARPYFQVEGRAISDSGGDVTGVVYRCKADGDLEGELTNGSFFLTSASGKGYGELTGDKRLYEWIHNATETPLTLDTTPDIITPTGVTAGTPGEFTPAGAEVPATITALRDLGLTPGAAWTTGQYVEIGSGNVYWDGTDWATGIAE